MTKLEARITPLFRKLAEARGQAFWYPSLVESCKTHGVTLIQDACWRGLAGEYRAGIAELPGHVLVMTPGRLRLHLALAMVPTRLTEPGSTLDHTSDPTRMAKTGLGFVWLWDGPSVQKFVDAVLAEIRARRLGTENFFCGQG